MDNLKDDKIQDPVKSKGKRMCLLPNTNVPTLQLKIHRHKGRLSRTENPTEQLNRRQLGNGWWWKNHLASGIYNNFPVLYFIV